MSGLKEFMGETTMHGVQYIFRGARVVRLAWLVGVVCACFGFLYFAIKAVDNYAGFPTNTKVDIVFNRSMPLPAITFCNVNFVQLSALKNTSSNYYLRQNQAFICAYYNISNEPVCPYSPAEIDRIIASDDRSASGVFADVGQAKESMILDGLVATVTSLPDYDFANSRQFDTIVSDQGICHTFNANNSHGLIRSTGVNNGAKFVLNIDQNQYAGVNVLSAGMEVYLHTPGERVIRGHDVIFVGPGQRANIALRPQRRELLGTPYRRPGCVSGNPNRNPLAPYSVSQCFLECQEILVAQRCRCLAVSVPPGQSIDGIKQPCSPADFFNCSADVQLEFQTNAAFGESCRKRCLPPCTPAPQQFKWDYSLSWDLFPSVVVGQGIIFPRLVDTGAYRNDLGLQDNLSYVRENFAQVNVFYNELSYQTIVEQEAVTLSTLFGSVGGNLGLFLGASMLTILEFCQYTVRVVLAKRRKRRQRRMVRDAENSYAGQATTATTPQQGNGNKLEAVV